MKSYLKVVFCTVFRSAELGVSSLQAQDSTATPSVLHIQQTQTTAPPNGSVPTFLATYHLLDGAKSPANLLALKGTLSMNNDSPNFSQVLWVLVYWKGECPAHDIDLKQIAGYLWLDITKNPSQSNSSFPVNLVFPNPLPATGCIGFYYGSGPVFADHCQNATAIDGEAFAVPTKLPAGHLLEIYGNISDSTLDGTNNFGPLPTGSWGTINDFYLLPGGCGIFEENLNSQGVPNPAPLATLRSWLPKDALHLVSVPQVDRVASGETSKAALQNQVETIFSVPVKVSAGDCMVTIYGRTGNGATDNETQVNALMAP